MRKNINMIFSLLLICSGAVMSFLGFYTSPVGEISDSVLWYFAQCLIYAGSVFGMKEYVDYMIGKINRK